MPTSDFLIAAEVVEAFRNLHGQILFDLRFVEEIAEQSSCKVFGECDFNQNPPSISIKSALNETDLVEILCHELAHLLCGLHAGHNDLWEQQRDELSAYFWSQRIGL